MQTMPAFNPRATMTDDAGNTVRFMIHPLDEQYLDAPGESCPAAMLPPQEWEVRKALLEVKYFNSRLAEYGIFQVLFNRGAWRDAKAIALEKQLALRRLVDSSPEHKAAIRRIVSAMPPDNGGREALADYTH